MSDGIFLEGKDSLGSFDNYDYGTANAVIAEAADCLGLLSEGGEQILSEKSIVKLDKQAKMAHLKKISTMAVAKDANDPLYKKLALLNKQRHEIYAKLEQRYGVKGQQRAREVIAAARQGGTMKRNTRQMGANKVGAFKR